jgi:hypothetical protein
MGAVPHLRSDLSLSTRYNGEVSLNKYYKSFAKLFVLDIGYYGRDIAFQGY